MAAAQNIFELNTEDVLGSKFRAFTSKVKGLSLTNASEYFLARSSLSKSLCDGNPGTRLFPATPPITTVPR